jgi:hypothetical protein
MVELGDGADLAREPVRPHGRGQLGTQDLQGDIAVVLDVARE